MFDGATTTQQRELQVIPHQAPISGKHDCNHSIREYPISKQLQDLKKLVTTPSLVYQGANFFLLINDLDIENQGNR